METLRSIERYPERKPGQKAWAVALYAVLTFAFFYPTGLFLNIHILPDMPLWWMPCFLVGVVPAAAAALVFFGAMIRARCRQPEALLSFRQFFLEWWVNGKLTILWAAWVVIAAAIAVLEGISNYRVNSVYVFDILVSLLLLYPLGIFLGRRDRLRLLHVIMDRCIFVLFLLVLLMLYRFARKEFPFYIFGRLFGFSKSRLLMGSNSNMCGAQCSFLALCALYRMQMFRSKGKKCLYLIMALALSFAVLLTQSVGSLLSLGVGATGMLCLYVYRRRRLRGAKYPTLTALLTGAAFVCVIAAAAFLVLRVLPSVLPGFKIRKISLAKIASISSRKKIWAATITHVFQDPHLMLHGCSSHAVTSFIEKWLGTRFHTHNQFLEILLSQGIPGFVFFLTWLVRTVLHSVRLCNDPKTSQALWLLPALLVSLLCGNMLEPFLLGRLYFVGSMFFLIGGYVSGLALSLREESAS